MTRHVKHCYAYFCTYEPSIERTARTQLIDAEEKGSIRVLTKVNNKNQEIQVKYVSS